MVLNPWGSSSIDNYERLFTEFGLERIKEEWKRELNHYLFKRNVVIAHRDFGKIVECVKEGRKFICLTGIASSGKLHFGHKTVLDLVKFFRSRGCICRIAVADIDAYTSREKIKTIAEARKYAVENVANLLAYGFKKKEIYLQSRKESRYYEFAFEISKKITPAEFQAIYGSLDLGKICANLLQYADILHLQLSEYFGKMPVVVPVAPDQDPHIRATRDVARRLPYDLELPSGVYIQHILSLRGSEKMSSSKPETCLFLTDSPEEAERKIRRAITGGGDTVEKHRKYGGVPEKCRVYMLLKMHHPSDRKVEEVYRLCKEGKLICGDCKSFCAEFIGKFLEKHRRRVEKKMKVALKICGTQS